MKTLRLFFVALLVSCFLPVGIRAQQEKQANQLPNGLSLEVISGKGERPIYQAVPNNSWYGRFRQIPATVMGEKALPVQAVNISARMEGEQVRVIVSVHLGKKFFERQDPVGSYLLRENERVVVTELTAFGVEPFEIGVIRVAPKSVALPGVRSQARSIKVINVQPVDSATFPTYKLTLLNTSAKNVSALFVETFVDGRRRTSSMPHNTDDATLIAAGATYDLKRQLNNIASSSSDGYAPETPPNQSVLIKAAIFEDGTYEGDAGAAAHYRGYALGNRTQLTKLVALYQKALEFTELDAKTVLDRLRIGVGALGITADDADMEKLMSDFPGLTEGEKSMMKAAIEVNMFELGKEALKGIGEFENKQGSKIDREEMRAWLRTNIEKYRKRRDNLKGF